MDAPDRIWHSIETAPRDGAWFRARTEYGTERFVHFDKPDDRYPISSDGAVWSTSPVEWTPDDIGPANGEALERATW